jgi:phosphatidylglycerophosphate synthase
MKENINYFIYLSKFIAWEIWLFLATLATIVFYLILVREISITFLRHNIRQTKNYSWQRIQLFVVSLVIILFYFFQLGNNVNYSLFQLPRLPKELLLIFSVSNICYLVNKLDLRLNHSQLKSPAKSYK